MILISVLTVFILASLFQGTVTPTQTVSYSEVKRQIADGRVQSVVLTETHLIAEPYNDDVPSRAVVPVQGDPELLPLLNAHDVEVFAEAPSGGSIIGALLPWIFLAGFFYFLTRRTSMGGAGFPGQGLGDLMAGRFSSPVSHGRKVTFADVAGQESAKQEVAELVDFLREPDRFSRVGAQVPHGVLLMGPPGTGKTLLARALAGEADVPFFSTTGSEFIEVFVGVGAGRVRKMFEAARNQAPSIIFIDELDSIGRTRGTGLGGGHDEREQTLNQILAEMDGFSGKHAVVVLAATNRPDVLDPALLRPGRFDRHVTLSLPDKQARRAILDIHARGLPLDASVDLDQIAAGTPGFSGADLKNLLNEAAISAARKGNVDIGLPDTEEARDKIMMGTVRTLAIQPDEKRRLAVHEAGHTAVAFHTPVADPIYKVTIIPRGRALGGTHALPENERHVLPEDYLRAQLSVLLAGRAAEKHFLGTVSSGAEDDIRRATDLARSMIARWGMDNDIGPVDLSNAEESPFLGRKIAQPVTFADETAGKVDEAVMAVLQQAEARAEALIKQHGDRIATLIARLETEETLGAAAIRECLDPGIITPVHDRAGKAGRSLCVSAQPPQDSKKGVNSDRGYEPYLSGD